MATNDPDSVIYKWGEVQVGVDPGFGNAAITFVNGARPEVSASGAIYQDMGTTEQKVRLPRWDTIATAQIIPFEDNRIGIFCPRCGKGKARPVAVLAVKAGREETCISCAAKYQLPSLDGLGLDPAGLRAIAKAALELAKKIERGEL